MTKIFLFQLTDSKDDDKERDNVDYPSGDGDDELSRRLPVVLLPLTDSRYMDRGEKSDEEEGDDDVLRDEGHLQKRRRMQKESPPSQQLPPSEPVLPVVKM